MIPSAFITEWRTRVPWPESYQVEQDLILSRLMVEIANNIAETTPFKAPTTIDHAVASRWWNGEAPIPTFVLDEMMSTKLRALYQRRKGRDLFDLLAGLDRR